MSPEIPSETPQPTLSEETNPPLSSGPVEPATELTDGTQLEQPVATKLPRSARSPKPSKQQPETAEDYTEKANTERSLGRFNFAFAGFIGGLALVSAEVARETYEKANDTLFAAGATTAFAGFSVISWGAIRSAQKLLKASKRSTAKAAELSGSAPSQNPSTPDTNQTEAEESL